MKGSENGGYLLSHKRSTIGAVGLNFSVRNGKRWIPDAINRLNMCTVHLYNTLQEKEYES